MARRKRTDLEVQRVKTSILQAALDLFDKNEYSQLSMRKIARKADCSVATIYNYYSCKDSLYLDVLKSGFELLHQTLISPYASEHPDNDLSAMSRRFFQFAVSHRNYYTLMFSRPLPKALDYVGTEMEEAACKEKAVALNTLDSLTAIIRDNINSGRINFAGDPSLLAKMFWAVSHGMVSLYHSKILQELDQEPEKSYTEVIDRFISCFEGNS